MTEPPQHSGVAALAEQLITFGRELDALRRRIESQQQRHIEHARAADRLADEQRAAADEQRAITRTLAGLAEQLAELAARVGDLEEEDDAVKLSRRSYFDLDQAADVNARLAHLAPWVSRVYLRYHETALAPCWLWHPAVVEELLWLERSWTEAYRGKTASTQAAADWHERHRPGVVRRLAAELGTCGLDKHSLHAELDRLPPRAPLADDTTLADIAAAWAAEQRAPHPTPDQLVQAGAGLP